MSEAIKKVLIVTNIPNPYRIPLFNEVMDQLDEHGIELKVVFGAAAYTRRKFNLDLSAIRFSYKILKASALHGSNSEKVLFTYSGIMKEIAAFRPDKIIVAGFSLTTFRIFLKSFFSKTDYIIWTGAVLFPGRYDSAPRKFLRRLLIRRASAFIAYGTKAKEYLTTMGADPRRIHISINTVDTTFFRNETDRIRKGLSRDTRKHLLYVGYLVPRKHVDRLIDLALALSATRNDFVLDIVGDGSARQALEEKVKSNSLGEFVRFHGFVQHEGLPRYYAQSDVFLFQTDFDIWGLVLNEAMAAGLPVLSSVKASATFDLIRDAENGFAVNYDQQKDVLQKLNNLLDDHALRESMGAKARQTIEGKATLRESAAGFVRALGIIKS